jgi:predicted nucleic acid-binding protein
MKYWDSSALIPLVVDDRSTEPIAILFHADPHIVTWWATPIECVSSMARRERDGSLDASATVTALSRLARFQAGWQEVQPVDALRDLAVRLLRVHVLRAADSLQLAAAIIASENRPASLDFVCLDKRLSLAAQREGFNVLTA